MSALTPERLGAALDALAGDLARARLAADAGLGPAADLPAVYARHPEALGPGALELAAELARTADTTQAGGDGDAGHAADLSPDLSPDRALAAWVAASNGRRAGAVAEARARVWRAGAVVRTPGGATVPFDTADAALAAAGDRATRLALGAARGALVAAELGPLCRERFARERGAVEALGMADGYLPTWHRLTNVEPRALADGCAALLRETASVWDDALAERATRRLGAPPRDLPGGLRRADEPALLADPDLDALLPAGAALAVARTQLAAMGLDAAAGGRMRYDVGARRTGAWDADAWCAAVRVPGEVYVVARPRAGVAAWGALLGAAGRGLHAAHTDPALPAAARRAGDASVRHAAGALFAALAGDAGWLRRYGVLGRERAGAVRRLAAFARLRGLRRDAAACRLAVLVLGGDVPAGEADDVAMALYAEATGARAAPGECLAYTAPWLGAAARVRGALLAAQVADALRERFDDDWWRNPRAGPWLAGALFAPGGSRTAAAVGHAVQGPPARSPVEPAGDNTWFGRALPAAARALEHALA